MLEISIESFVKKGKKKKAKIKGIERSKRETKTISKRLL